MCQHGISYSTIVYGELAAQYVRGLASIRGGCCMSAVLVSVQEVCEKELVVDTERRNVGSGGKELVVDTEGRIRGIWW